MSTSQLALIRADTVPAVAVPAVVTEKTVVTTQTVAATAVPAMGLKQQMCQNALWIFIIISIIVLIILYALARPAQDWLAGLNNSWTWLKAGSNMVVMGVILAIVVLLMAYVSFFAYLHANLIDQKAIVITFGITMILLIVWFGLFYVQRDLNTSAWFGLLVLIAAIFQTYYVFKVSRSAGWGMIPYLLWVIVAIAFNFQLKASNTV